MGLVGQLGLLKELMGIPIAAVLDSLLLLALPEEVEQLEVKEGEGVVWVCDFEHFVRLLVDAVP